MKIDKKLLEEAIGQVKKEFNKDFNNILLEEPVIAESSFNRIKDKVDNTEVAFVVMSADRHEHSRKENDARLTELKATFAQNGFPMTDIQGSWLEKDDDGNEVRVLEKSIVITNEERGDVPISGTSLFYLATKMSDKYNQDAFIFGDIGKHTGKRSIDAYDRNGNRVAYGGPWTSVEPIEKDADFWSRVRGSTFVFKEQQEEEVIEVDAPNSVIEAMIKTEMHKGKKVKFVRRKK